MRNKIQIGKEIVNVVWEYEKRRAFLFDGFQARLNNLNAKTERSASKLYDKILSSLDLKENLVDSAVDNLSKIDKLMSGIDKIQNAYKKEYKKIIVIERNLDWISLIGREEKITKLLSEVNIIEKSRTTRSKESKKLLGMLRQKNYKRINQILDKWKNFVYDMFYVGVTRGMDVAKFKSLFYTKAGTLKIGSSFSQETERESIVSVTEERTAFLRQRAKEMGYKCCWNSNPMDMRTKPECMSASLDGVITEAKMGTDHGFPPRYICRCEIVYTRGEWVDVNKGVNSAIENRRKKLLSELITAPKQLSVWMSAGKEVRVDPEKDSLRAAGKKPYKEIEDKIKLIEGTVVPEFEFDMSLEGG